MNWIFGVCLFISSTVIAQQSKKLENIKGEWTLSNEITPVQARENAIRQAKAEALRQAGVPEFITESNLLYRSEKKMPIDEIYESLTTVDVSGEISEFSIVREDKLVTEYGNILYQVWINATVTLHNTSKDPAFNLEVTGVRESYLSPDKLAFEIRPWKDGYLTIFILSENSSNQLYPNKLEKQRKLEAQKIYGFPKSKVLDYEVTAEKEVEINYLLLLFTKQEIPFLKEETPENILKFIAGISPSEKCLKTYSLLIKK